jgi:hypothetical protein
MPSYRQLRFPSCQHKFMDSANTSANSELDGYYSRTICCNKIQALSLLPRSATRGQLTYQLGRAAQFLGPQTRGPLLGCIRVTFCLLPRRLFIDEFSCGASGGGATEFLRFNNVSRTMCFAGLVSPSLRSSNKRAAVVPS